MENVRVYEIPKCKMVSSKCGMFGDVALDEFSRWMESLPKTAFPNDFLWFDEGRGGFVWYHMWFPGLDAPETFEIVDFPGGLYAVACDVDGQNNESAIDSIRQFINEKGCFAEDTTRKQLGNIITPGSAQKAMGYSQMDYYIPIKIVTQY